MTTPSSGRGKRRERVREAFDECTREKHGPNAGTRSWSRVSGLFGLLLLSLLFLEAQAVLAAIAFGSAEWETFAGWFRWQGGFASSTLLPYAAKHWRSLSNLGGGGGGP